MQSPGCGGDGHTASVRRYALVSATSAPVVLIGGWTWAAADQPAGYSSTRDTISALAARGATDRWIMTVALALLGVCHLITASGLVEARFVARVLLALGGLATIAVASLPQPSTGHVPAATIGFVALALWPAMAALPARRAAWVATSAMLVLLGWLAVEIHGGDLLGLSERAVAGVEALWPLAVVLTLAFARPKTAASVS